jgi:hypothetical protein
MLFKALEKLPSPPVWGYIQKAILNGNYLNEELRIMPKSISTVAIGVKNLNTVLNLWVTAVLYR